MLDFPHVADNVLVRIHFLDLELSVLEVIDHRLNDLWSELRGTSRPSTLFQ
ncbi:hypothetical protein EMIT0P260_10148 [Pseudomonas sp. IT-P260]